MRTIPLSDLHERAKSRPAGYVEDVLSRAESVTATHYTLSDEAYAELAAKYRRPSPPEAGSMGPGELKAFLAEMDRRKAICQSDRCGRFGGDDGARTLVLCGKSGCRDQRLHSLKWACPKGLFPDA